MAYSPVGAGAVRIPSRPWAPRQGAVKAVGAAVWEPSTGGLFRPRRRFPSMVRLHRTSIEEFAMADLAFVVTVLAGFALVALVAKGVTKL
ncbi:hypothetical protein GCM10010365_20140 [Streptomyces poonensis]|uniref:Uncharacterized protein n=1 Tax=Streptomyces poonensis TaxID=68255 RepID=A0A918PDJ2_9ACTN|nr:hypothetical protein GCM10010365_20140 [Streptomyces poonensis]GLJ90372.1 hypothetical protein GCM10017589_29750 [Streptomyces poonensis]